MSPMKLEAGGNPWRRKPSAPPAVSAASTPAPGLSSESAITESAAAEITQTPAASPSTPSIRLITLITATIPTIVSRWPRWTLPTGAKSNSSDRAQVDPADERERERARVDAVEDRDRGGDGLAAELQQRREVVDVVEHPDDDDHHGADQQRLGLLGPGQEEDRGDAGADEDRQAAELRGRVGVQAAGVGVVDRADPPRDPLRHRHQQPGEHGGDQEREQRLDRLRAAVDEHG